MPTLSQVFGCSPPIDCPGTDNPVLNLSSEAADHAILIGLNWGPPFVPPADNGFVSNGCITECDSQISQQDADLCAARQSLLCVFDKGNNPNPLPGPAIVCNTTQTATVFCPDGLPFTYTVPAGLFCGDSLTLVNQRAQAYAAQLAKQLKICLDNPQQCTCINQPYSSQVNISGATSSGVTWSIDNGSLPPGLTLSQTGAIAGTPTVAGTYNFTVLAVTSLGTFMQKPFNIVVLQITTTSLPTFVIGNAYSAQLNATGGSGNYSWKITQGFLPDGLSLATSGLISGTPTGVNSGSGNITFGVIDLNCEAADQTAFPPSVQLSGKSTTTVGTILGFDEYIASSPPKRYRRLTWSGSSEQQLFSNSTRQYVKSSAIGAYVPSTVSWEFSPSVGYSPFVNPGQSFPVPGVPTINRITQFQGGWGIAFLSATDPTIYQSYSNPGPSVTGTYTKFQGSDQTYPNSFTITGPFNIVPGNQIGGAKYIYSGASEIDFFGNYLSTYSKNLSEMCNAADKQATILAPDGVAVPFSGWIGPTSFEQCSPPGLPYTAEGDVAFKRGQGARFDVSGFWGSAAGVDFPRSAWNITDSTHLVSNDTGSSTSANYFNSPNQQPSTTFFGPFPGKVVWIHNYSATLDEEYTEFDALTAGDTFSAAGLIASYLRSGFTVIQTAVNFTLNFSNLVKGQSYLASYQLFNVALGTTQTVQFGFTATGTTFAFHGTVGPPPSGQSILVRNPTVAFVQ